MARAVTPARKITVTIAAWLVGLVIAFPIIWMVLTSFKTELEASSLPPKFLFFDWTMENYAIVQQRSDYFHHAVNSLIIAGGSVLLGAASSPCRRPGPWRSAPTERTRDMLLWMLSTKMMPPVGVMVPIYLFFRDVGLLDTRIGLVVSCASAICRSSCGCCSPISRKSPRTFSRRRAWTARRSARSSSTC